MFTNRHIAWILGVSVAVGVFWLVFCAGERFEAVKESEATLKQQQRQVVEMTIEKREQQQELNAVNARLNRLEEKVYAN